jgi:hypothetical protein
MTLDEIRESVPPSVRKHITDDVAKVIDDVANKEGKEFATVFKKRIISHALVLKDGRYKFTDYLKAIEYVSLKMTGYSDIDAYMVAFPDRYRRLLKKYEELGDEATIRSRKISSFVSEYNSNELVVRIAEQAIVPSHILNAPIYQDAVNVLAELMMTARSEKVRADSASSLLTHLKPPETAKIEIDMNVSNRSVIDELREATLRYSKAQQIGIESGSVTATKVAEEHIVEVETED